MCFQIEAAHSSSALLLKKKKKSFLYQNRDFAHLNCRIHTQFSEQMALNLFLIIGDEVQYTLNVDELGCASQMFSGIFEEKKDMIEIQSSIVTKEWLQL